MDDLKNQILNLARKIEEGNLADELGSLVMQAMEEGYSEEDSIAEATEQYREIIGLLSPEYKCVKLDASDLLTITIDGIEYDLDDKTTPKLRKATEHRMSIEAILADFDNGYEEIISQIEARLNNK